jgi:hypothetical protein
MSGATCPVPGCGSSVPRGNVVCVACYFALPSHEARLLVRTRIVRDRAESEEARARMSEVLDRYIAVAISHLPTRAAAPAPGTPAEQDAWSDLGYQKVGAR